MQELLLQVEEFARRAHGDQRRKFEDELYIVHPIRVMNSCREYDSRNTVLAAALLHDVLEDTVTTEEALNEFLQNLFSREDAAQTLLLVQELTDKYTKQHYPEWNRRERKNREAQRLADCSAAAQTIKYADIIDNSLTIVGSGDEFAEKYLREVQHLLKGINRGNPLLYEKALETVKTCLQQVKG